MSRIRELASRLATRVESGPRKRLDLALSVLITRVGLATFAFVGLGGTPHAAFSFIQHVELRSPDARFLLRGARPHDDRIVIIGIDEKTLRKVGSYPIARNAYAQLIPTTARRTCC